MLLAPRDGAEGLRMRQVALRQRLVEVDLHPFLDDDTFSHCVPRPAARWSLPRHPEPAPRDRAIPSRRHPALATLHLCDAGTGTAYSTNATHTATHATTPTT